MASLEVFAQVLRMCAAVGMVRVGVVSIDGTKIATNAARGANRSADTIRAEARRIAEEVVAEATEADAAEDAEDDGEDGVGLPPRFAGRGGRAANIKNALAELDRQDGEHDRVTRRIGPGPRSTYAGSRPARHSPAPHPRALTGSACTGLGCVASSSAARRPARTRWPARQPGMRQGLPRRRWRGPRHKPTPGRSMPAVHVPGRATGAIVSPGHGADPAGRSTPPIPTAG